MKNSAPMDDKSKRVARIESAIRRVIAEALLSKLRDPRSKGIITITRVQVSPDLSVARVFYTAMGPDGRQRTAQRMFEDSHGLFQSLIADRLDIRSVPRLVFAWDKQLEKETHITNLIDEVMAEDQAKGSRGESEGG